MKNKIITLSRLNLFKDNKAGRTSILKFSVRNGYPRITTFINGGDRSVRGLDNLIVTPFTYSGLNLFISALKNIIDDPKDTAYDIQCYNAKYIDGVKTDDTYLQGTITVGKDESGTIYLKMQADEKPTVRFDLTIPKIFFKMQKNGVELTDTEEGSKLFTKGYVAQIETAFNDLMKDYNESYSPEQSY